MVVLITYDLNKPGQDYSDLYDAIKNISITWCHCFTSVWLVDTNFSTQQIYTELKGRIDKNDQLFIVRTTEDYTGYLTTKALEWLRNRVSF